MRSSLLAQVNAFFRARESRLPADQRILYDPWANKLHPGTFFFQLIRFARFVVPPLGRLVAELQTAHCVRHAAMDALVLGAVSEGYTQVVVLGAGHDMRPARFEEALGLTAWFEVDRAATLAIKAKIGGPAVTRLDADLTDPDLYGRLQAAGLTPQRPTLLILEGVAHYLPLPTLQALFHQFHPLRRARIVLSFIRPEMAARGDNIFRRLWRWTGELPQTWLGNTELSALSPHWRLVGAWDQATQVRDFVPHAAGRLTRLSQDIALLEKEIT